MFYCRSRQVAAEKVHIKKTSEKEALLLLEAPKFPLSEKKLRPT